MTTTKLFVKPLKKEGAKSNKKTANFWAKNQNNGLKKKKDTSAPLPLVLWRIPAQGTDVTQVAWSGCYLVATPKERNIIQSIKLWYTWTYRCPVSQHKNQFHGKTVCINTIISFKFNWQSVGLFAIRLNACRFLEHISKRQINKSSES